MAVPEMIHRLSEAEYLAIERAADFKSEVFANVKFQPSSLRVTARLPGRKQVVE